MKDILNIVCNLQVEESPPELYEAFLIALANDFLENEKEQEDKNRKKEKEI